jgi:hypothetical protein
MNKVNANFENQKVFVGLDVHILLAAFIFSPTFIRLRRTTMASADFCMSSKTKLDTDLPMDQKRKRKVLEMKKLIHKFDITPDNLGLQLSIKNL